MPWATLYLLSEWSIRILMLVYVPQKRSAAASRTWLLLIFLLPWPGLVLYALFGRIYVPRHRIRMQARAVRHLNAVQDHLRSRVRAEPEIPPDLHPIVTLATQMGDFPPFAGNQIELLTDYDGTIGRLVADLDAARHQAHLLFYIFAPDKTGTRIIEALQRAATRGVRCRVLVDAVGSRPGLRKLRERLEKGGVEVLEALPVGLFRRNTARFDLRNHRKLAVIDGRVAYTGSQNLVDPEFIPGCPNEELMVRVLGPVVAQLEGIFLADCSSETGRPIREADLSPEVAIAGRSIAQAIPSGPGYRCENARDLLLEMLYVARLRVVLVTPYFVPDEPVIMAIRSARRRGVEVTVVVPEQSNHPVTRLAQQSCYEDLLDTGVAIHLYRPRFLHAKHVTVDDHLALIGSTNIDVRSFALNAELNLLVYDPAVVAGLRQVQAAYLAQSHRIEAAAWRRRPLASRVLQNIARLADSLL
ncbi:MAG TPA: cardiolipin synthase [Verrucomicrobiales bacterium]|nr:cardiolipin synthase [Verrucomicrobiales bacterium]